jgi:hypothetical protein
MLTNRRILQLLTGCVVFAFSSFFLLPSSAAGPPFDVTGTWYWAQGIPTTNAASVPIGKWSGTFTISQDTPGKYTGTFSDTSIMEGILVGSDAIGFTRRIVGSPGPDEKGNATQSWAGKIEDRKEGGLKMSGTWSGAYDYLLKDANVSNGFLATRT